jgi:hypothetical protein
MVQRPGCRRASRSPEPRPASCPHPVPGPAFPGVSRGGRRAFRSVEPRRNPLRYDQLVPELVPRLHPTAPTATLAAASERGSRAPSLIEGAVPRRACRGPLSPRSARQQVALSTARCHRRFVAGFAVAFPPTHARHPRRHGFLATTGFVRPESVRVTFDRTSFTGRRRPLGAGGGVAL